VSSLSFWLAQNPSEERFPASGNDKKIGVTKQRVKGGLK